MCCTQATMSTNMSLGVWFVVVMQRVWSLSQEFHSREVCIKASNHCLPLHSLNRKVMTLADLIIFFH